MVQGVVAIPFEAKHVAASLTPDTTTSVDVRVRKSANPLGAGKVVMSMTRNLNRVTGAPVLLTTRRRISSVPNVELFAGSDVKSRTRFGAFAAATVASISTIGIVVKLTSGDDRFSGPGAPKRCPAPADVPFVSTK